MIWPEGSLVRVAGAGPAGMAAALTAARNGYRVELSERHPRVAHRWNNGIQMLENFSVEEDALEHLRSLGLPDPPVLRVAHACLIGDDRRVRHELRSREPMGYFILRGPGPGTFDRWLESLCRDAGVVFRFGETVTESDCEISAAGPREAAAMAAERVHRVVSGTDVVDVRFADELAPNGYAYCFRLDDCLTIGVAFIGTYGRAHEYLDRATGVFAKEHGLEPMDEGERLVSRMSFRRLSQEPEAGPLRVGEAIGLQDMLFGLGLRKVISSGVIAARCRGDEALYQKVLFECYDREMGRAARRRRHLERLGFGRLPALMSLARLFPGRRLLRLLYG